MTLTHSPDVVDNRSLVRREQTDGNHLVVDALKLNDVRTIYGLVGWSASRSPTSRALHRYRAFATSASVTKAMPSMQLPPPDSSRDDRVCA